MSLKRWVLVLGVWCTAATALAEAPNLQQMDLVMKSIPNGPVALVNGETISPEEFRDLYRGEVGRWSQMNPTQEISDEVRIGVALGVLRELIERTLLYQEALDRGMSVSDADLQAAWQKQVEAMQRALARKEGRAEGSLPSEQQVLEASGGTREQALAELRKALLIEQARAAIIKEEGVAVTDQEVADWYNQYKDQTSRPDMMQLKQIFFRAPENAPAGKKRDAERKADEALRKIQAGQSFEGVARSDSEGSYKEEGGDWGMVPVTKLPPFVVEIANKMQPGDTSGVIESEYGYHIIKLVEIVPGKQYTLDEVEEDVRAMLMQDKGADAVRRFCDAATANSEEITVFLDLEKQLVDKPELLQALQHMFGEAPAES